MDIIIKKAVLNDLEYILMLNHQLFELENKNFDSTLNVGWSYSNKGLEYFKDLLDKEQILIAISNDKIIGYLAWSIDTESSYIIKPYAELDNICVLEEYRKCGIGTKLINEFKMICQTKGINEIKVKAYAKNIDAIRFYMKNNFKDFEMILKVDI